MDKKKYVSPHYELLKFDASIVTSTSQCHEVTVSIMTSSTPGQCDTSDTTNTVWEGSDPF